MSQWTRYCLLDCRRHRPSINVSKGSTIVSRCNINNMVFLGRIRAGKKNKVRVWGLSDDSAFNIRRRVHLWASQRMLRLSCNRLTGMGNSRQISFEIWEEELLVKTISQHCLNFPPMESGRLLGISWERRVWEGSWKDRFGRFWNFWQKTCLEIIGYF